MRELTVETSFEGIETLIDIAVTLADYTQSIEGAREIPSFLGRVLDVPEVALSVIQQPNEDSDPQTVIFGSYIRGGMATAGQFSAEQMMGIYLRIKVLMQEEDDAGHRTMQMRYPDGPILETKDGLLERNVFAYALDSTHLMQLVFGHRLREQGADSLQSSNFLAIARELAKQLHCLVAWRSSPWVLGTPFDKLTRREWVVLRGLDSDASEKQLAAQLCQRPHTLHSHIKSIYQKVGVQGRLPLLQVFHAALRQMRIEMHNRQQEQQEISRLNPVGVVRRL